VFKGNIGDSCIFFDLLLLNNKDKFVNWDSGLLDCIVINKFKVLELCRIFVLESTTLLPSCNVLMLLLSWFVKKYFLANHIRLSSKKLKLAMSLLKCVYCFEASIPTLSFKNNSCILFIKFDEFDSPKLLSFADVHTFFDALSELKKFTPKSFLACVKALELRTKLSERSEFLSNQRSSFEDFKASWVFRPVKDKAVL